MADNLQSGKLAVILHADVAGSTALVQRDEQLAHERIHAAFRRFGNTIAKYHGHVRELRGDALLAEFERTSDAVTAALAFQAEQISYNGQLNDRIQPTLRVGIAMGEVIVADDTITGTGVVLAQRLEQLSEPGSVVIQGAAYETIPGRFPFEYENLGEHEVKGFVEPVRAYSISLKHDSDIPHPSPLVHKSHKMIIPVACVAVIILGLALTWFQPWRTDETRSSLNFSDSPLPDQPSIAVLPFANMSNDEDQEYFSDGITDDLITDLSKLRALIVIARNSSFAYKNKAIDVRQVGKELGVRHILQGSVRKSGDLLRVNAQLVDTETGDHIWAERFDRPLENIFLIQDEIGQKITASLDIALSEGEQARIWRQTTNDPEAYELFLRGRAEYLRFNPEANYRAQQALEKAVELDPNFAEAWVKLSWVHGMAASSGWSESKTASLQESWNCVNRALELDESLADVHARLFELYGVDGDPAHASQAIEKAVALNPNGAKNIAIYAFDLASQNRIEEALTAMQKAMRLNPNPPTWYLNVLGHIYLAADRNDDAVNILEDCTARSPEYISCAVRLTIAYMAVGREEDARGQAKEVLRINPKFSSSAWVKLVGPTFATRRLGLLQQVGLPE